MIGIQTTKARRNIGKTILAYVALASIAVLAVVIYMWFSASLDHGSNEVQGVRTWDFVLKSVLPLEQEDLSAIRAINRIGRAEQHDETSVYLWISGEAENRAAYEAEAAAAETALTTLAAQREAARVEKLVSSTAQAPDPAAAAELEAMQEKLNAEAQRLDGLRRELDAEQARLREREARLSSERFELNEHGSALNDADAQISADPAWEGWDSQQSHNAQRDAWYAEGESFLDAVTLYERDKHRVDRAERDYAAALAAYERECGELEQLRKDLEQVPEPEVPEISDCTWQIARNPDAVNAFDRQKTGISPLHVSLQMLFFGIAALAAWFFFAKLLSAAAGSIVKPNPAAEKETSGTSAMPDEEETDTEETEET